MKRAAVLLLIAMLTLSSCTGRTANHIAARSGTDASISSETVTCTDAAQTGRSLPDTDLRQRAAEVDLTTLSVQMSYAQLSNMMLSPEEYAGKTVKLKGRFAHAAEETREFFVCYLLDATACCSQSLEFETDESFDFPAGYPAQDSEITVFGVFDTYRYNGFTMYRLLHAEVDY